MCHSYEMDRKLLEFIQMLKIREEQAWKKLWQKKEKRNW